MDATTDSTLAAVARTLYRCVRGFDEGDIDLMADCYAEDAELIGPDRSVTVGRPAIRAALHDRQTWRLGEGQAPRHFISNVEILESSGSTVRTSAYFALIIATPDGIAITAKGVYRDELVDDGDCWRIARRDVRVDAG